MGGKILYRPVHLSPGVAIEGRKGLPFAIAADETHHGLLEETELSSGVLRLLISNAVGILTLDAMGAVDSLASQGIIIGQGAPRQGLNPNMRAIKAILTGTPLRACSKYLLRESESS